MLTKMRENMALVMWILVIAFIGTIIFSWGMGGFQGNVKPGIVATINGKDISMEYFENMIQNAYVAKLNETGEEPGEDMIKEIRQQVWNELIQTTVIEEEIKRLKIPVTDQEVAFAVRNSPPEFIRTHEAFQTDGEFDMSKYQSFLADPAAARDLMIIEENYRQTLKNQKLIDRVLGTVRVSESEVLQTYLDQNLKAEVSYVFFDKNSIPQDTSEFPQDVLENYYFSHIQEYRSPEMRNIEYVSFSIVPSYEDTLANEDQAREMLMRIEEGDDFAELAATYSNDESNAEKGGDLGFFGRNRMVKEFEDAAFGAEIGDIVGPIKTRFGFHVIKVTDKKTEDGEEQVQASHILIKFQAGNETIDNARRNAFLFAEEAKDADFHELAAIYGVEVMETDYFAPGGYIPRLGNLISLSEFVFNQPVDRTTEVYYIREAYYIFHTIGIRKEKVKPLEEVKGNITNALIEERQFSTLEEKAQNFRDRIVQPEDFVRIANEDSLEITDVTTPFAFEDYVPGIGRQKAFNGAALALKEPGDISQPVKLNRGYYIIKLLEKTGVDSVDLAAQKEEIFRQLLIQKRNNAYTAWLAQLESNAKIQDNRYLYYRDY